MDWTTLFARRPRWIVLVLLLLTASGGAAFNLLPRREDPELVGRFAQILTRLPGADAARVEALVTKPLEDKIREHEHLGEVVSTSREGVSFLIAELADDVKDPPAELARLRDLVSEAEAELPAAAGKPDFDDYRPEAWAMLAALVWTGSETAPEPIMRRIAEDLADRFRNLEGCKESELFGDVEEEFRVRFDAATLARYGLDARRVASTLSRSDPKLRSGRVRNAAHELDIRLTGAVDGLERLRSIVIRDEGTDGGALLVGDIAEVTRGTTDPRRQRALVDDKRAVLVGARLASRERADLWATRAHAMLRNFRETLPPDLELRVVFDQSRYVRARLEGLALNLLIGASLVALVIFVFFGFRASILVALALPLTTLGVLACLAQLGIPLHQMSVTGMILALGLLIDNAIIVVDEVRGQLARHAERMHALAASVRHLALPLLGSTVTTALAFLPIAIMPGPAGDFVSSISVSVILAIFLSLILSLTIIAALAARVLPQEIEAKASGLRRSLTTGVELPRLARAHDRLLGLFVRRPWLGISLSLLMPLVGFFGASTLDEQFFPPAERDQFQLQLLMPAHASLEATEAVVREMQREVTRIDGVRASFTVIGNSAPLVYYNMMSGQDDSAWFAQSIIEVTSADRCRAVVREVQDRLDRALTGAQCIAREFEQGPPVTAPIELLIYGEDPQRLVDLSEEYRNVLAEIPGVVHTRATLNADLPRLEFRLDEQEAEAAGLRLEDIRERLETGLEGRIAASVLEGSEFVPVRASFGLRERSTATGATSIELATPGGVVPLSALGEFSLVPSVSSLPRRNGRRRTAIYAFLEPGLLPAKVLAEVQKKRAELPALAMPSGYEFAVGGESAERDNAMGGLFASVAILTVLMLATLVLTLGSFRLAGMISIVAGLSIGLAFCSLFVFGQVLGFMAILGAMGLVGVAINDSIVVLAAIRADAAASAGDPDAIQRVVAHSARHVLATTVTTIAGFLPLILAGGEFWPPLVIGIAGGVLGATILALWFVPSCYRLMRSRRVALS